MKSIFASLVAAALLVAATARAQDGSAPPTAPQAEVEPDLAALMAKQQERHIKLWFAGQAGNWPLAGYEIGELEDGFDDVGKMLGGDLVDNVVGAALKGLDKVIADKNRSGFPAAFDALSAGCNNCHHMLDHAFISIQRPTLLPYSDQSFAPSK